MFEPSASWEVLRLRAALLGQVREFFGARGYLEVETPILSSDVVVDRHLDPFVTTLDRNPRQPGTGPTLYLQTSPEFHMKRLLAAGGPAMYQVSRAFRNGEIGPLHNPEFTIVEWYTPGSIYEQGMQLLSDLVERLLARGPAERIAYRAAFEQHVGIDPHRASTEELAAAAALGVAVPETLARADRDAWLELLLIEKVEPHLGHQRPQILYDYPATQAALARVRPGDPPVAERFEIYVSSIELANGYHELVDPEALSQRNRRANRLRVADGKEPLGEESRLLEAMRAGLPPAVGVALGFDRIVMLAAGRRTLDEVMAFPVTRA